MNGKEKLFLAGVDKYATGMKTLSRILWRSTLLAFCALGVAAAVGLTIQFTSLPWKIYRTLSEWPATCSEPSHILLMGGSGIPGKSGLMRTYYAAQMAVRYPAAPLWVAMPKSPAESAAAQAYLDELQLRGVSAKRIHFLAGGRNTREQALSLARELGAGACASCVLIVTDPEHIRRTAACIQKVCPAGLLPCPAFSISLEAPAPWRAADLDSTALPSAPRRLIPDIGGALRWRYDLWNHLGYTLDSLREVAALTYYRLRGWI